MGENRTYKMGQKPKTHKMVQKQKIYAEANAEKTSGPHDKSRHGGGRLRRPPTCGEGRPKAAPHHVAW